MTEQTTKTEFTPELIEFATKMSENFNTLEVGRYCSENIKYAIEYKDRLNDWHTGDEATTPFRVQKTKDLPIIMEFSRNKIKSNADWNNSNFLFSAILWCVAANDVGDIYAADIVALEEYLKHGRSRRDMYNGWCEMFIVNASDSNLERFNNLSIHLET